MLVIRLILYPLLATLSILAFVPSILDGLCPAGPLSKNTKPHMGKFESQRKKINPVLTKLAQNELMILRPSIESFFIPNYATIRPMRSPRVKESSSFSDIWNYFTKGLWKKLALIGCVRVGIDALNYAYVNLKPMVFDCCNFVLMEFRPSRDLIVLKLRHGITSVLRQAHARTENIEKSLICGFKNVLACTFTRNAYLTLYTFGRKMHTTIQSNHASQRFMELIHISQQARLLAMKVLDKRADISLTNAFRLLLVCLIVCLQLPECFPCLGIGILYTCCLVECFILLNRYSQPLRNTKRLLCWYINDHVERLQKSWRIIRHISLHIFSKMSEPLLWHLLSQVKNNLNSDAFFTSHYSVKTSQRTASKEAPVLSAPYFTSYKDGEPSLLKLSHMFMGDGLSDQMPLAKVRSLGFHVETPANAQDRGSAYLHKAIKDIRTLPCCSSYINTRGKLGDVDSTQTEPCYCEANIPDTESERTIDALTDPVKDTRVSLQLIPRKDIAISPENQETQDDLLLPKTRPLAQVRERKYAQPVYDLEKVNEGREKEDISETGLEEITSRWTSEEVVQYTGEQDPSQVDEKNDDSRHLAANNREEEVFDLEIRISNYQAHERYTFDCINEILDQWAQNKVELVPLLSHEIERTAAIRKYEEEIKYYLQAAQQEPQPSRWRCYLSFKSEYVDEQWEMIKLITSTCATISKYDRERRLALKREALPDFGKITILMESYVNDNKQDETIQGRLEEVEATYKRREKINRAFLDKERPLFADVSEKLSVLQARCIDYTDALRKREQESPGYITSLPSQLKAAHRKLGKWV